MGWSFPLGTVKGTTIRVHLTFLLFLVWIGGTHYLRGGAAAAAAGVLFMALLFTCVLLHEFGHVAAARRYGVQTPDITLLPISGVAQLERIPEKPGEELVVALAGPAVNVAIAALLALALGGVPSASDGMEVENPGMGLLARLFWVNVSLVLFNLIPAFPMDGGRVLRALLAYRLGYTRGTRIAASIGQAVAFGLGLLGLFGNPLLLFVALFVYMGAASEASAVQLREAGQRMIASDAAVTRFDTLSPSSTIEDAVESLLRTSQHEFPVVDGAGRLRGVLTREDMIRALREQGADTPVLDVMRRDIPVMHHRQPLDEALRVLQGGKLPAIGVADADGKLLGLITPENVGELMMVQAARPPRPPPANPWQRDPAGSVAPP